MTGYGDLFDLDASFQVSYVFFKYKRVYIECKLDVAFGVVLPGWRKDCVGLA